MQERDNEARKRESEEKRKRRLADEIRADFERRREERRSLENGWLLNMNFLSGNQYCDISPDGETEEEDKRFYWQSRRVNHIAPMVDSRIAKLTRMRPALHVRAFSDEEGDLRAARLATAVLAGVARADRAGRDRRPGDPLVGGVRKRVLQDFMGRERGTAGGRRRKRRPRVRGRDIRRGGASL